MQLFACMPSNTTATLNCTQLYNSRPRYKSPPVQCAPHVSTSTRMPCSTPCAPCDVHCPAQESLHPSAAPPSKHGLTTLAYSAASQVMQQPVRLPLPLGHSTATGRHGLTKACCKLTLATKSSRCGCTATSHRLQACCSTAAWFHQRLLQAYPRHQNLQVRLRSNCNKLQACPALPLGGSAATRLCTVT